MDCLPLVLASASPRRRELLTLLGVPFVVDAPDVDEHCVLTASAAVQEISRRKAKAGAVAHPGQAVLAADTLVTLDGHPLGKPSNEEDAFRMLSSLSGRWHHVYTGVCVVSAQGELFSGMDDSMVRFAAMSDAEIRAYIATGEPMDKAGAYALQGIAAQFVEQVQGVPSGIIGLPLPLTRRLLCQAGVL